MSCAPSPRQCVKKEKQLRNTSHTLFQIYVPQRCSSCRDKTHSSYLHSEPSSSPRKAARSEGHSFDVTLIKNASHLNSELAFTTQLQFPAPGGNPLSKALLLVEEASVAEVHPVEKASVAEVHPGPREICLKVIKKTLTQPTPKIPNQKSNKKPHTPTKKNL